MPVAVTVVKMIGRGVVKVHRQLDQTQTEDAGIEIDIRLRMACDCRHMMNARNVVLHTTYPCAITLMPARLKSLHTSRNLFPKWQIILPHHHIATPIRQHPRTAQIIKAHITGRAGRLRHRPIPRMWQPKLPSFLQGIAISGTKICIQQPPQSDVSLFKPVRQHRFETCPKAIADELQISDKSSRRNRILPRSAETRKYPETGVHARLPVCGSELEETRQLSRRG